MTTEKKYLYLLKLILSTALFCGALFFENAQERRIILLVTIFAAYLAVGFVRFLTGQNHRYFYWSIYLDIILIFLMEQNSRLLINYFFHSFYIIILLEAVLSLDLKKGILTGSAAVLVSMIKYGYLIYYKLSLASISQMAFFLMVNILILVTSGFAHHNREERQKKDLLYRELLDAHKQLKQYSDEVSRLSMIEERTRIARDIHDTLGHNMTALIMQLQMTEHLYQEDEDRARKLLEGAVNTAKDSLYHIREVVETLRGEETEYHADAIRLLISDFSEKTGSVIRLEINDEKATNGSGDNQNGAAINNTAKRKDSDARMALYRIIQEALTNAVRHGKATEITVKIEYLTGEIRFYIHDNGIGSEDYNEGYGLRGMKERAKACGGSVNFMSGQGFSVDGVLYTEERDD